MGVGFFVAIYSNIVILGTLVLLAGHLLPEHRPACALMRPVLPVQFLRQGSPSAGLSRFLLSGQQDSGLDRSKSSVRLAQPGPVAIPNPPFLRRPILFDPNSLELTSAGRNMLKGATAWLRRHHEARILIVGSCDSSGSESCTRTLAEARGAVVQKFLRSSGIDTDQIVGVKAWDNRDHSCQPSEIECQQLDRSARIFMASSVAP